MRDFLANTVLGLEGYTVDVAMNGKEGLAAILADPPDLVITDHAMPGLTGLEMVQTVREAGLHTPIILMTAEGSEELAAHALRAGVSYYFIKPFDAMELQEAVETILRPPAVEPPPKEEIGITGDQALSILKSIRIPTIVVDTERRIIFSNGAAAKFLPAAGEESAVGKRIGEVMVNAILLDMFENPTRIPPDPEIQLADGSTYEARSSVVPGGGQVIQLHDTTPLHEVNRKKSEFVLTVAHDLRSPLTAILSYVELLARFGDLNPQQAALTAQLRDGVAQVTHLIDDLLELSRIEAGMDTHNEPVQIQEVAENALAALKSRAELKKQHLRKTFARKRLQVMANPVRLRQVFANLIDNAIKYTPDGGEIKVTLTGEGGQVMCSISDTGIGIPVDAQGHIFDKFYRADGVLDTYDGTGLGLSIVKSIVESYDGRIWVDSSPGKGATFTVVIPSYPSEQS